MKQASKILIALFIANIPCNIVAMLGTMKSIATTRACISSTKTATLFPRQPHTTIRSFNNKPDRWSIPAMTPGHILHCLGKIKDEQHYILISTNHRGRPNYKPSDWEVRMGPINNLNIIPLVQQEISGSYCGKARQHYEAHTKLITKDNHTIRLYYSKEGRPGCKNIVAPERLSSCFIYNPDLKEVEILKTNKTH